MSISATLANALSGLTAASRGAQIVSSNVANATTEGYARRVLDLSPRMTGGLGAGVQVDGVSRILDETLLRERRLADASLAGADTTVDFYKDLFALVGEPDQPGSLTSVFAAFETSLSEAMSRPEVDARLAGVLDAAQTLASRLGTLSDGVQSLREDADLQIETDVATLNAKLAQIADLNGDILRARGADQDYPSLLDQRQRLVDEISGIVPLRVLPRENDTIALYTQGGALLVDVEAAEFGFTAKAPITADMTLASGALSGLMLNGRALAIDSDNSPIAGGRLGALFEVRDDLAPTAQSALDEIARDLVSRFEDSTLDPTLAPGAAGLFTDRGAPLDPLDNVGLAGRLEINALVDPAAGGDLWRIRDGLGAVTAGPPGENGLLSAMRDRLLERRTPGDPILGTSAKSTGEMASAFLSQMAQDLDTTRSTLAFETARFEGMRAAELAGGVDTDQEMQRLLLIEQAYAANARVIQTADELLDLLIGL